MIDEKMMLAVGARNKAEFLSYVEKSILSIINEDENEANVPDTTANDTDITTSNNSAALSLPESMKSTSTAPSSSAGPNLSMN